ncbi:hypothetical protein HYPSUDRAFT_44402 [Hypholoma sublateritium FD-334 SS-4]|uniref:F-box domain-containing protein n=1 Tax=Hypholoma sublateritium (strain FD-334 SS-4) TaxID=945553 RepID=A0A0D2PGE9_HYPSF|nr:hypothetical protein HYPSUDRAFT_44402 [Hypholoma sublateritium FD-334 SS-4]
MFPFLHFPQEILIDILSNIDAISLVRCASTSKKLYSTLRNSSQLRCITEMHLDGIEEVIVSNDHASILEKILCHRSAWRFLHWTSYHCIPMSHLCKAYELVGGVFSQTGDHVLQTVQLPTRTRATYTSDELVFAFVVRDFAMDPTQDVIALLEDDDTPLFVTAIRVIRIHIRTISNNINHPLARPNPLEFEIAPDLLHGNGMHSATLQIVCDLISVYITRNSRARVLIWQWTEGRLLYDSGDGLMSSLPHDTSDFALLGQNSFLVTRTRDSGSIALYKLHLYPISNPLHVATFHLPDIKPNSRLIALRTHAGPIEANPLPDSYFKREDKNRIHVFTLSYTSFTSPGATLSRMTALGMYVHQNVFVSHLEDCAEKNQEVVDVKWDDWGPNYTRLMRDRSPSHWLRYAHGQRIICSTNTNTVEILDFSLSACSEIEFLSNYHDGLSSGSNSGGTSSESSSRQTLSLPPHPSLPGPLPNHGIRQQLDLMQPSIFNVCSSSVFSVNVETRLPCRLTTKGLPTAYYAYMLYEDGIIGVKVR